MATIKSQYGSDIFYCSFCKKPKKLKQMSNKVFLGEPMCKKCVKMDVLSDFPSSVQR